jgi:hypothetical protein
MPRNELHDDASNNLQLLIGAIKHTSSVVMLGIEQAAASAFDTNIRRSLFITRFSSSAD